MPSSTNWYVTVILEVAGKKQSIRGPDRGSEGAAKADLKDLQERLGTGEWINLDWISADPKRVVAAHTDRTTVSFF